MKERGTNTRARRGLGEDWVLNHVGMTVSNRNATLQHFQSLGVGVSVGPLPLLPYEEGEGSLMFYQRLDGDPITRTYPTGGVHHFTDGECQIGNCQLECYPMRPGSGIFLSEYLAKKGPGINHICFNAPDVEEDTKWLVDKGCAIMFNALVNGRTVENYLDSRRVGDIMISLRPPASDWEKEWKKNNESKKYILSEDDIRNFQGHLLPAITKNKGKNIAFSEYGAGGPKFQFEDFKKFSTTRGY